MLVVAVRALFKGRMMEISRFPRDRKVEWDYLRIEIRERIFFPCFRLNLKKLSEFNCVGEKQMSSFRNGLQQVEAT